MTVEKADKKTIRLIKAAENKLKEIKQIIASAPTPEMRDELATDFLKRLKATENKLKEKE